MVARDERPQYAVFFEKCYVEKQPFKLASLSLDVCGSFVDIAVPPLAT